MGLVTSSMYDSVYEASLFFSFHEKVGLEHVGVYLHFYYISFSHTQASYMRIDCACVCVCEHTVTILSRIFLVFFLVLFCLKLPPANQSKLAVRLNGGRGKKREERKGLFITVSEVINGRVAAVVGFLWRHLCKELAISSPSSPSSSHEPTKTTKRKREGMPLTNKAHYRASFK